MQLCLTLLLLIVLLFLYNGSLQNDQKAQQSLLATPSQMPPTQEPLVGTGGFGGSGLDMDNICANFPNLPSSSLNSLISSVKNLASSATSTLAIFRIKCVGSSASLSLTTNNIENYLNSANMLYPMLFEQYNQVINLRGSYYREPISRCFDELDGEVRRVVARLDRFIQALQTFTSNPNTIPRGKNSGDYCNRLVGFDIPNPYD
jgi:hypothetical protein